MLTALLVVLSAAPVIPLQSGVLTPPLIGTPSEAALAYVTSRRDELGIDRRLTMKAGATFATKFGGTVQVDAFINQLPVDGMRVSVTFDQSQRVIRTASSLKPFGAVKLEPAITINEAIDVASRDVQHSLISSQGQRYGAAKKGAYLIGGELHLGYLVFVPTLKNSENWHLVVDATDASIVLRQNRAWRSNAADVYPSSPGGLDAGVGVAAVVRETLLGLPADAGGFLNGTLIRALNCCPTVGCAHDAPALRSQGQLGVGGGQTVNYDVAICDQRPLASNDPAVHASGDFVYPPIDPPNTANPSINTPADYDEFAEVHAYFHVNKAYLHAIGLSTTSVGADAGFSAFRMRATPDLPAVWVNVSDADFNHSTPNAQGVYVANTLARTDNAMYLARESMDFVLLPPQVLQSDALVIYQGAKADFAYDGPVLWHEFGHGVVHSTSDFQPFIALDARGANNESAALNEGMADLLSAMTGNDPAVGIYVGPRIDSSSSAIRNLENTFRCPDVLWGESHQDSMHFSGAVWEARKQFTGLDNGATFDAAIYAALVSFPVDLTFEKAGSIVVAAVAHAFPERPDARAAMQTIMEARGVLNCSKVLDVTSSTTKRPYFAIPGTDDLALAANARVPGPIQFKLRLPQGARRIDVDGLMQAYGTNSRLEILSADHPITFTASGSVLINDAQGSVVPAVDQQTSVVHGQLTLGKPCGSEIYLALVNTSRRARQVYELGFTVTPADTSCALEVDGGVPDAGMVDAGVVVADAGVVVRPPISLTAVPATLGAQTQGCGCNAVSPLGVIAVALVFFRRRARRA